MNVGVNASIANVDVDFNRAFPAGVAGFCLLAGVGPEALEGEVAIVLDDVAALPVGLTCLSARALCSH